MPVPQSFIVAAKRTPFGAFGGKWVPCLVDFLAVCEHMLKIA